MSLKNIGIVSLILESFQLLLFIMILLLLSGPQTNEVSTSMKC